MAGKDAAADEAPDADDIMSPAEMKPLLAKAKKGQSISCAIGLTKAKDGLILLDRKRKPKKLLAELKKQAAGMNLEIETTTLRFGMAMVDKEQDPTLVRFVVNKDAPGALRPKLIEYVKKCGYSKLEITVGAVDE